MFFDLASNNRMDIFENRRTRLAALIDEVANGNQAEFSRLTGIKAPQINRWLSTKANEQRNITEGSARKIEQLTGKESGWLDHPPYTFITIKEPAPPPYNEFNANIRRVISIMKVLGPRDQERVVFAAELVEAEAAQERQNHRQLAGQ